jgi:hypothetical protein
MTSRYMTMFPYMTMITNMDRRLVMKTCKFIPCCKYDSSAKSSIVTDTNIL